MSLSNINSGERLHIAFFGLRNVGKSSLVNAIAGQNMSIVSDTLGTTTDPVKKSMEILPLGPVVLVDTPGIDDEGELGKLRVDRAYEQLEIADICVAVLDYNKDLSSQETDLLKKIKAKDKPFLIVFNKLDNKSSYKNLDLNSLSSKYNVILGEVILNETNIVCLSALEKYNIELFKEKLANISKSLDKEKYIVADLIKEKSTVVLVIPIDESAPKGRIILPQQLVLRELLEHSCTTVICREFELEESLEKLKEKPDLVITDSQVFDYVSKVVSADICLTSFSVLFARYKGELDYFIKGLDILANLKQNDKILISEACTHHRQCNDIGTVKMPTWLEEYSGVKLNYIFSSGNEFPNDLDKVKLVVHCGACMITEQAMKARLEKLHKENIPIVNYGLAIAKMKGIFDRAIEIFS